MEVFSLIFFKHNNAKKKVFLDLKIQVLLSPIIQFFQVLPNTEV